MKLFADGADFNGIVEAAKNPKIVGFTTNPTLMKQAGVTDYVKFSHEIIAHLADNRPDTSISLEVFADDINSMYQQAKEIHNWSQLANYRVYVKIPITTTKGESTLGVVKELSNEGISCNVTAVFTKKQLYQTIECINHFVPGIISVFAGRIADAGVDPVGIIKYGIKHFEKKWKNNNTKLEFLWASPREPYNYIQAEKCGCDIITMTPALISKLDTFGKDLNEFSLDTVKMFYNDAVASGYKI
jgi:transaldolase